MKIKLSPILLNTPLDLSRSGDTLTINGETFDFSPLPEGATLPEEAIASDWFAGPVERIDGVLHVALILSHGANAPEKTLFPAPLILAGDGPVSLPPFDAEEVDA